MNTFPLIMHRFLWLLAALSAQLFALSSSSATELTDLGQGLAYLRIHSLADSEKALRSAVPGTGALVLDLRYVAAGDEPLDALRAALAGRGGPSAPLFILISPATPPAVAQAVSSGLTLGAADMRPAPKVTVGTDAATDRRAYDAFEAGTPVEKLISGKIEKERFDEATLVHEFKNGNPTAEPPIPPDPSAPKPAASPVERLVDRVLQRAVHLHRALLALKAR